MQKTSVRPQKRSVDLDAYIGNRVRTRRQQLGMAQSALANYLRVSFQQVQKYERGSNRISAASLHHIAHALDVPISYFFAGISAPSVPSAPVTSNPRRSQLQRLVDAYTQIGQPKTRRLLLHLAELVAAKS